MKRYHLRVSHGEAAPAEEHDFDTLDELLIAVNANRKKGLYCIPFDRVADQLLVIPDDPNQLDLFL